MSALPTAYRIRNWSQHFENNRTREVVNMVWVPVPNKHDGEGFRRIMREPDGIVIYGCWHLILQVASKSLRHRGTLLRDDGTPMTAESISLKTGWGSVDNFQRALDFLSSPQVAWIETFTPAPATTSQEGATSSRVARARGHDRRGQNSTEQNITEDERERVESVNVCLKDGSEEVKRNLADPRANPVNIALSLTGEFDNDRARGFLAKARTVIGEVAFRQELIAFAAEIAAGEEPENRGAALTARLRRALEARS
jgi:hypothetical protein